MNEAYIIFVVTLVLNWTQLLFLLQLLLRFLQKTFHQEVITAILRTLLVNLA